MTRKKSYTIQTDRVYWTTLTMDGSALIDQSAIQHNNNIIIIVSIKLIKLSHHH